MVRLKGDIWLIDPALGFSFNSNMVRLKDKQNLQSIKDKTKFQFQYGAIKRRFLNSILAMSFLVSIPIWCD